MTLDRRTTMVVALIAGFITLLLATAGGASAQVATCHQTAAPGGPIATPSALLTALQPGQTGCFRAGTYTGGLTINKANVTLRTYPGDVHATLAGRVVVASPGVTVERLNLDGRNSGSLPSPTINGADTILRGNDITNFDSAYACISVSTNGTAIPDRVRIENNRIHDCSASGSDGVAVNSGTQGTIAGNAIFDNGDDGVQLYPGPTNLTITRNTIDGNGRGLHWANSTANTAVTNSVVSNSRNYWNLWRSNLSGTGNSANVICAQASATNSTYNTRGGIMTGLEPTVTLGAYTVRTATDPLFVNRASKNFRLVSLPGTNCQDGADPDTAGNAADSELSAAPAASSSNANPSFTFGASKTGATFECKLDGPGTTTGTWGTCSSPRNYTGLAAGSYVFSVRSTVGGITELSPRTHSFTITGGDTTPPDTTIASGPSGATASSSASFTFTSTETPSTFECKLDGPGSTTGTWATCTTPRDYTGLADGSYTFNVRAKDAANNTDASPATRTFSVDTTAPNTTIDSSTGTTTPNPSFTFSSSEPTGASFECRLDTPSGTGTFSTCSSPRSYSSLAAGTYTFHVRAKDAVGNTDGSAATQTFTVAPSDTTPPQTTIDSGPSGTITTSSASFTFSSSEPTGATFQCRLDTPAGNGTFGSCSSPQDYSSLANGSHTFHVKAKDQAGNEDATAATQTFTVSVTTPPAVTFQDGFEGTAFPTTYLTGAWCGDCGPNSDGKLTFGAGSYVNQVTPSGYSATEGTKVMEARAGLNTANTGSRAELQCHRTGTPHRCAGGEGTEFIYEWDMRIPLGETWASGNVNRPNVMQTKPTSPPPGYTGPVNDSCYGGGILASGNPDSTKIDLSIIVRGGVPIAPDFGCDVPTDHDGILDETDLGTFTRGVWHHIKLHAKWSTSATVGFTAVEIDGVAVLPKRFNRNYFGEGRDMTFRPGIYATPSYNQNTVQYDNVKISMP